MRHGFLNLLAAATLADEGVDRATVEAIVAETDADAIKVGSAGIGWRGLHAGTDAVRRTRARRFKSYGSCSFEEPVEDLLELGLLGSFPP